MQLAADTTDTARAAIRRVLDGDAPNGTTPADCGPWADVVAGVFAGYAASGTPGARAAWAAIARANPGAARLVAEAPSPIKAEAAPARSSIPELPPEARACYALEQPCGQWLDSYIAYALKAAPMGPRSFHELAGLFAISLAVARRAVLPTSIGDIFPNIFALWIGEPAIYSKTSALRALTRLINDAGLRHLLLPERLTPEALMLQYSLSIPPTLEQWQAEARAQWIEEKAYSSRRGWLLDESSRLFASLKVDYNAGLLGLLLQLYDCPDEKSEETTGRGRVIVTDTYMSFFGVATPNGMAEHFTNRALWENGLWSRFALIMPDSVPPWQFLGEHVPIPSSLLQQYRSIFDLFPARAAQLVEEDDAKRRYVHVSGSSDASRIILHPSVRDAWETYTKATRYDMLLSGTIDRALFGSYGRFGTQAIKVAMLLATMDATELPIVIELRHWIRAQKIVETWRAGLHRIWSEGAQTEEARDTDRILAKLAEAGRRGLLARDLYRHLAIKSADCNAMLEELEKSGHVEKLPGQNANGRPITFWRLIEG